jgi:tRNA (adenine37-N6)-methyltransferase
VVANVTRPFGSGLKRFRSDFIVLRTILSWPVWQALKQRFIKVCRKMDEITYRPIGVIRSPFKQAEGMPIQSSAAQGVAGTVELEPEFAAGLKDLDGFSHILLLYHFHMSKGHSLEVKPFLDDVLRGVFATRAPKRPNPIGISVVRLTGIEGSTLRIEDVDILDGTPLLDIKPHVPEFDCRQAARIGWLTGKTSPALSTVADGRFAN